MRSLGSSTAIVTLLAWSAGACGPRRELGDLPDTRDSSTSSSTHNASANEAVTDSAAEQGPATTDSTDRGGASDTTLGDVCEPPAFPDEPASDVLLRIQNDSAGPIFVRGPDCYHEIFTVDPPEGVGGSVTWTCNLPCADAVSGASCACEACTPGYTRIETGIQYAAQWRGRLFAELPLPPCSACAGVTSCQSPFTAPPGIYRLSVEVYAPSPDCGAACACESPGSAHCRLERPVLEPLPVVFSIDVVHPNEPDVLILVQ